MANIYQDRVIFDGIEHSSAVRFYNSVLKSGAPWNALLKYDEFAFLEVQLFYLTNQSMLYFDIFFN